MTVTFGEKCGKKTCIYADGEFKGALYPKEIIEYGLEDDSEVSCEVIERMMQDTLLLRAKRYVMNLLVKADETEAELKRKLKENGYCEETAEGALEYVKSYHYIDEFRMAENFIRARMYQYSEKEIRFKLAEKGVNEEAVDMAYEEILESEEDEDPEIKAAENFLGKRIKGSLGEDELSYEEKQKLMASAYRKGFRTETIKKAINNLERVKGDNL